MDPASSSLHVVSNVSRTCTVPVVCGTNIVYNRSPACQDNMLTC